MSARDLQLEALFARALVERPNLDVNAARFSAHVSRVASDAADDALQAGDLLLACACLDGDPAGLATFEREHIAELPHQLARITTDAALVDEVKQLTRQRLLVGAAPRLATYSGRGPLGAWVRVVATRIALDLLRLRDPHSGAEDLALQTAALGDDPELEYIKTQHYDSVKAAFTAALDGLEPRQRTLLRYSLLDGLTIDEMAAATRQHRTTVMRLLAQVREQLISEVRRQLGERLRCGRGEVEQLLELLGSRLELSLSRLLA
jgi:RNA polymerase sigma-70 factor, ECF subfamily